jgi:choline dehydrogenase-like flavoprotein
MKLTARSLQPDAVLDSDVCIVGAGAAGITLACELDGSGLSVLLLEAGDEEFNSAAQDGLLGDLPAGSVHCPPHMYRRRMLGGATSIWGGRCVPLDPIDLEHRPYVRHSGWPITWDELNAWYPRAQAYCQAGSHAYDVADALGPDARPLLAGFHNADVLATRLERFSPPTHFAKVHARRLSRSANVRILLQAQAIRLHARSAVVDALEAASAPGRRITVRARHFVVAVGGLETPRLLMLSDDTRRAGLGNAGGALGRYYMCHIENTLGRLRLLPASRPVALDFERAPDGTYLRRKFVLSDEAQRRHALLNTTARLHYRPIADPAHGSGILSAMYLVKDAVLPEYRRKLATIELAHRDRLVRDHRFWLSHIGNVACDAVAVARFGATWIRRRILAARKLPFVVVRSRDGVYPLDLNAEQTPNPDSRVGLSAKSDRLGMPRLFVDWRLTGQDVDSLVRVMRHLRDAFARSGCAQLEFDDATLEDQVRASTPVGGHHLGTARMSETPADGVVDANCAVHGLSNLFVAGGAVFPTCGHANPTLTIVALAARLAAHLKTKAACPAVPTLSSLPEVA